MPTCSHAGSRFGSQTESLRLSRLYCPGRGSSDTAAVGTTNREKELVVERIESVKGRLSSETLALQCARVRARAHCTVSDLRAELSDLWAQLTVLARDFVSGRLIWKQQPELTPFLGL